MTYKYIITSKLICDKNKQNQMKIPKYTNSFFN